MFKHRKSYFTVLILCLILTVTAAPSFADAGHGSGGGNGENRTIPLTLESTSVADGASNVAVNETIQLNFNKNICNVTVLANNKKCFHLTDEAGEPVAICLIFPDNQVQQDYRREVFIRPSEDLKANSLYKVSIDSTLVAKNGTSIDNAHTFSFTTGDFRTDQENKILKKLGENIILYETAYGETADSVPVNKSGLDDVSQNHEDGAGSAARITAIVLILVILIFTVIFFVLRRRKE